METMNDTILFHRAPGDEQRTRIIQTITVSARVILSTSTQPAGSSFAPATRRISGQPIEVLPMPIAASKLRTRIGARIA